MVRRCDLTAVRPVDSEAPPTIIRVVGGASSGLCEWCVSVGPCRRPRPVDVAAGRQSSPCAVDTGHVIMTVCDA